MDGSLPPLPDVPLDVVQDDEGFSAELSIDRELSFREMAVFEAAAVHLPRVFRTEGQRRFRGMATIDDETLWVYVHVTGPGRCDQSAADGVRDMAAGLWTSIHAAAAAS
jgi:hypothetical protein